MDAVSILILQHGQSVLKAAADKLAWDEQSGRPSDTCRQVLAWEQSAQQHKHALPLQLVLLAGVMHAQVMLGHYPNLQIYSLKHTLIAHEQYM